MFNQWIRCFKTKQLSQRARAQANRLRPFLEMLEDRLVPAVLNVNSTADILSPPPGVLTLRSAIQAANATTGNNTINLTVAGTYKITLAGAVEDNNATGDFEIIPNLASPPNSTLLIQNTSGSTVIVDGNQLDRVFDINPGGTSNPATKIKVTMQGFTIQNGVASNTASPDEPNATGGGIRDQGNADLALTNMVVTNNNATADGGGLVVNSSWTLTINNSTISNNHAGDAGGGIDAPGAFTGAVTFLNDTINGNVATNGGGVFWAGAGSSTFTVKNTIIAKNFAPRPGRTPTTPPAPLPTTAAT
jgi:hypothetical protein